MERLCCIVITLFLYSRILYAFDGPPQQPLIDINTADQQTIAAALQGVGLKKAQAIIDYRELVGGIRLVDELEAVKGIGKATINKNRQRIMINSNAAKPDR